MRQSNRFFTCLRSKPKRGCVKNHDSYDPKFVDLIEFHARPCENGIIRYSFKLISDFEALYDSRTTSLESPDAPSLMDHAFGNYMILDP